MEMRNLSLSHEQIELLCQAIGMAEYRFTQLYKEILNETVLVRGVVSKTEQEEKAKFYLDLAFKMSDLNLEITNGETDI